MCTCVVAQLVDGAVRGKFLASAYKALSGPGTLEALEGSLQWRCLWGPMGVLPALMEPLVGEAPSRQAARQVWPTWAGVNFAREDGHLQKPQSLHRCWAVFARQDELLPVSRGS